ncbi:MAG TPA: hypothetical protein DCM05_05170 [Elusimicrobia bacterium]|nr:hypothetical protein [Elusimicrobiota bacterium]
MSGLFRTFLACAALSLPAHAQEESGDELDARLTRVEGAVYVHTSTGSEEEFLPAEEDMSLEAGDLVRTGSGASAEVTLGGDSIIELGPDTDFIVDSLAPEESGFRLGIGSLVAKIQALLEGRRMDFHTHAAVCSVRGTELALTQEGDDQPAHVGVFDEGRVSVRSRGADGETLLGPGQEAEVRRGLPPGKARRLKALLGRKGRLAFVRQRHSSLPSRWKPRSPQERRALRMKFGGRKPLRPEQLKGIGEKLRQRRYDRSKPRRPSLQRKNPPRRGPEQRLKGPPPKERLKQGGQKRPQERQRRQKPGKRR